MSCNSSISELRNAIHEIIRKKRIEIELENQTISSLSFRMIPKQTIHSSLKVISGVSTLAALGAGGFYYLQADYSFRKYKDAKNGDDITKYKDLAKQNDRFVIMSGAGATVLYGWFLIECHTVNRLQKVEAISLYMPKKNTIGLFAQVRF